MNKNHVRVFIDYISSRNRDSAILVTSDMGLTTGQVFFFVQSRSCCDSGGVTTVKISMITVSQYSFTRVNTIYMIIII